MRIKARITGALVGVAVAAVAGCGGMQTGNQDAGGGDGSAQMLNGCTTYEDNTASGANRRIVWDLSVSSQPSRCMRVRVNDTVTFEGNFVNHPLVPQGGAAPTPFSMVDRANPGTAEERAAFTFTTAGTYGYVCAIHPSMTGAILVVP